MAIDQHEREIRRQYIGSSDAAAIVGADRYRTAGDVWCEKTGRYNRAKTETKITQVGTYVEPALLQWVEDSLARPVQRALTFVHSNGIARANLDGLCVEQAPALLIEAKTAGIVARPQYLHEYGEEGTDQVPDHVLIQVHHQFAVLEQQELEPVTLALVPTLLVQRGLILFKIPKSENLCQALLELEERFWRDHVQADTPPSEIPSLTTLKALRREERVVPIEATVAAVWQQAREARLAAEKHEAEAQRYLLAALGDADTGECADGRVTYRSHTRAGYTVPATTVRQLRWVPPKQEKKGKSKKK